MDFDYCYNTAWQVLEVRKAGVAAYPHKQYVWDLRYIDAPVCRIRDADTDGQTLETLYYTTDANMNVTALVDPAGAVVERYAYDAYGRVTTLDATWTQTAPAYDNVLLYCGYRHEPGTGYYHVHFRVYDVGLGRWAQRDPLGYVDGLNLYSNVSGRPTGFVDPFGTKQWNVWKPRCQRKHARILRTEGIDAARSFFRTCMRAPAGFDCLSDVCSVGSGSSTRYYACGDTPPTPGPSRPLPTWDNAVTRCEDRAGECRRRHAECLARAAKDALKCAGGPLGDGVTVAVACVTGCKLFLEPTLFSACFTACMGIDALVTMARVASCVDNLYTEKASCDAAQVFCYHRVMQGGRAAPVLISCS